MKKCKMLLVLILAAVVLAASACSRDTAPDEAEPPYDQDHEPGPGYAADITENDQGQQQDDDYDFDWTGYNIIIDGEIGVAANWHTAYGEDFPTHIPLLPVAEALRVDVVVSDDEAQTVVMQGLTGVITFTVGSQEFDVDGNVVELWQPSILVDDNLYVPIAFFRDVYGMGNAAWIGGHVYLDTHGMGDMH